MNWKQALSAHFTLTSYALKNSFICNLIFFPENITHVKIKTTRETDLYKLFHNNS